MPMKVNLKCCSTTNNDLLSCKCLEFCVDGMFVWQSRDKVISVSKMQRCPYSEGPCSRVESRHADQQYF